VSSSAAARVASPVTPDEAIEKRMALVSDIERRASRKQPLDFRLPVLGFYVAVLLHLTHNP
jgi:hypothetical protein